MRKIQVCLLLAVAALAAPNTFAKEACETSRLLKRALPSLEALDLEEPEVETKLIVPDSRTMDAMKLMVDTQISLPGSSGKMVTFNVEFNAVHYSEETFYDRLKNGKLALYNKGGLLRQRTRWDKRLGAKDYTFSYSAFQAKDASTADHGNLTVGVYARNEIGGKKYRSKKKFKSDKKELLSANTDDEAVKFARKLLGFDGDFQEILFIAQDRFFLKISQKGKADPGTPAFYLSLDKVSEEGLVGAKAKSSRRLAELEIIDDLNQGSTRNADSKLFMLNQMSDYLRKRFYLKAAPADKYAMGVEDTVFVRPWNP